MRSSVRDYLDALTNWYVRRCRDRFWAGDADAFDTLYTVLEMLARVAAPLLPLVDRGDLARADRRARSVHLTDWPVADELPADDELVAAMDRVREVCSAALSLRKAHGLRVRLPLRRSRWPRPTPTRCRPFADLIADEVNVRRSCSPTTSAGRRPSGCNWCRRLGPRLGSDIQQVIRAVKAGDWTVDGDAVPWAASCCRRRVHPRARRRGRQASARARRKTGVVVLDTEVTPELEAEGRARDVVRLVQQARRDAGLDVSDRIVLTLDAPGAVVDAVREHETFVAGEMLATSVVTERSDSDAEPVITVVRA